MRATERVLRGIGLFLGVATLATACVQFEDVTTQATETVGAGDGLVGDPGDCVTVDMAVSSEKIDLMRDLANEFNASDLAAVDDRCVFVRPQSKASGRAADLLSSTWDEAVEGPRPVIWSPASSAWAAVVNQRLADAGQPAIAVDPVPFMQTPLVIAMPAPMAEALGYPDEPIGYGDILALSRNPEGWAAFGHPEWGPFRLGKTNPNFSTSGLSALIAQNYAAVGKVRGLTLEDLARDDVQEFARGIESAVVHYGPTTLTFLNNWYRNDARGTTLTYASAAAVEEVSIVQYNRGNPDGVLQPGEVPEPPRVPLVAIYPEEGTLFSDNPFIILDAEWVDSRQAEAAAIFQEFVLRPENQTRVLEFGFRPGNIEVPLADPIVPANGVDPTQPQTTLEVPDPAVMVRLLEDWESQRKGARVLLVVDVSGSMGDPAGDGRETKLDLAKEAAIRALDQFAPQDQVGLRIFTTDIGPQEHTGWVDVLPITPIAQGVEELRTRIRQLVPQAGTPLYEATADAYRDMVAGYDPTLINAIVLLTDGVNDDGDPSDDQAQLEAVVRALSAGSEGARAQPVRVFTIAYGQDADLATMRRLAEASDAAVYDASDPRVIDDVFTSVISNF
jgi:Ca-activated chloride channel homolog